MNRYESGEENLSASDVLRELEFIMDEEGDGSTMDVYLWDAIRQFVWQKHEAERYGGRQDDCGDDFIHEVERVIGFKAIEKPNGDTTSEYCPHCDTVVELEPELKVQKCPNCGKRIVACSMCRAADAPGNYCTHCCLSYQAEVENEENEA